jgi:hypothetical protein
MPLHLMFLKKNQSELVYRKTCLNRIPLGLNNLFSLDRFKLHRHLVDGTVKCVWFRQVFGLLRVRFRQVSLYMYLLEQEWMSTVSSHICIYNPYWSVI